MAFSVRARRGIARQYLKGKHPNQKLLLPLRQLTHPSTQPLRISCSESREGVWLIMWLVITQTQLFLFPGFLTFHCIWIFFTLSSRFSILITPTYLFIISITHDPTRFFLSTSFCSCLKIFIGLLHIQITNFKFIKKNLVVLVILCL